MAMFVEIALNIAWQLYGNITTMSLPLVFTFVLAMAVSSSVFIYLALFLLAPVPRAPFFSEKFYITSQASGGASSPQPLPCWHDAWLQHGKDDDKTRQISEKHTSTIEEAELQMSVVIPAYNEEERLEIMLEEAVAFLDAEYGRAPMMKGKTPQIGWVNGDVGPRMGGYEILIVNDGSQDKTVDVALAFSQKRGLHDVLRICTLKKNRGKGGAVTHGFRHVRGAYAIFADADGASRFRDLGKLVKGCQEVADASGRAIAVGSRAHLVGSEAVVQRSALRNALMHSFHLLLRLLTPPATSRIRDTQCGFKLFSRACLPHIIPYMHAEGWIFDVEMLMLAESAPPTVASPHLSSGIHVVEVPVVWSEVGGSKLHVLWDSLAMAYDLALLRAAWLLGVYKRL